MPGQPAQDHPRRARRRPQYRQDRAIPSLDASTQKGRAAVAWTMRRAYGQCMVAALCVKVSSKPQLHSCECGHISKRTQHGADTCRLVRDPRFTLLLSCIFCVLRPLHSTPANFRSVENCSIWTSAIIGYVSKNVASLKSGAIA